MVSLDGGKNGHGPPTCFTDFKKWKKSKKSYFLWKNTYIKAI